MIHTSNKTFISISISFYVASYKHLWFHRWLMCVSKCSSFAPDKIITRQQWKFWHCHIGQE
jgi:hypothetical protein